MNKKLCCVALFFSLISSMIFANTITSYKIVDIGVLGADESRAIAINDRGQVLGKLKDNGKWHIFLWSYEQGLQILNLPEGAYVSFNNRGQIAGTYSEGIFTWDVETGFYHVGSFTGDKLNIIGFNDHGQLLISSFEQTLLKSNSLCVWDQGKTTDLLAEFNKQFPDNDSRIRAVAMNNNGEVFIWQFIINDESHSILIKSFVWSDGLFKELFKEFGPNTSVMVKTVDDHGNMILDVTEVPVKYIYNNYYDWIYHSFVELEDYLSPKTLMINSQKGIQAEIDFNRRNAVFINQSPQIVFCLPSQLKKRFDGISYYNAGVEIRKILEPSYPYWFSEYSDFRICSQNSFGYVVGNSQTVYYKQKHAFLAIPQ